MKISKKTKERGDTCKFHLTFFGGFIFYDIYDSIMKTITTALLSLAATSLFAQTEINTPTNIAYGVDAISSAVWNVEQDIVIDGSLTFEKEIGQYAIVIKNGKSFTVSSTGVVDLNSKPAANYTTGNHINIGNFSSTPSSLIIENGGKLYTTKISITGEGSQITLGATDALKTSTGGSTTIFFYKNGTLNLCAAGAFSFNFQTQANSIATLSFIEGTRLNVMGNVNANNYTMNLVDFDETNSIFFSSKIDSIGDECTLTLEDLGSSYAVSFYNGDTLKKKITLAGADLSGFSLSETTVDGVNGYLLSAAIPEPAEWAMIFGAIALGLAVYRRRK